MEILVERLIQIGLFAGQAIIVVVALIVIIGFIFNLAQRSKSSGDELEIEDLNKKYKKLAKPLKNYDLSKKELKQSAKKEKKNNKDKKNKNEDKKKTKTYVIDFNGDIKAAATESLRQEISSIISATEKNQANTEVVICLESPGGVVHGYGLAASQLKRIKDHGLKLTVCVDKVAASGGYMMACVADQILTAPFAILGSIGVLAQVPNVHRLLKKHDIDYREITAGEYKRTISMLGEITEKGEEKFTEQIADTHTLFKDFVSSQRPSLDIGQVATGEYWFGTKAHELGLSDGISTSDEYLLEKHINDSSILKVKFEQKKGLKEKLGIVASDALHNSLLKIWQSIENRKYL